MFATSWPRKTIRMKPMVLSLKDSVLNVVTTSKALQLYKPGQRTKDKQYSTRVSNVEQKKMKIRNLRWKIHLKNV